MKRPAIPSDDAQMLAAWAAASAVLDPEIPVLTLEDLGVLRGVERRDGRIVVKLTPTYTGCPATLAIQLDVEAALQDAGLPDARVETVLSPPWTRTRSPRRAAASCASSASRRPPERWPRRSGAVPALRLGPHGAHLGIRLHRLQGALALHGLPRAVRLFQMPVAAGAHDYHALRIAEVRHETADAISVAFEVPEALTAAVRQQAGSAPWRARYHRWRGAAALLFDLVASGRAPAPHCHQAGAGRPVLGVGQRHARRPAKCWT